MPILVKVMPSLVSLVPRKESWFFLSFFPLPSKLVRNPGWLNRGIVNAHSGITKCRSGGENWALEMAGFGHWRWEIVALGIAIQERSRIPIYRQRWIIKQKRTKTWETTFEQHYKILKRKRSSRVSLKILEFRPLRFANACSENCMPAGEIVMPNESFEKRPKNFSRLWNFCFLKDENEENKRQTMICEEFLKRKSRKTWEIQRQLWRKRKIKMIIGWNLKR